MQPRHRQSSLTALVAIVSLHLALLALLLHYQPKLGAAHADVMMVSMITPPQPLPVEAPPEPPKPKAPPPKKIHHAVTPPLPATSETAISLPPGAQVDVEAVPALEHLFPRGVRRGVHEKRCSQQRRKWNASSATA